MSNEHVHGAPLERRTLLSGLVGSATALAASACSESPTSGAAGETTTPTPSPAEQPSAAVNAVRRSVLLAYFSRAGENYYYGDRTDLDVGNTEVLARMIAEQVDCDVYEIDAAEPYSSDYDDTVARNVREQDAEARPAIANPLPSIEGYDVVLLASPIWNVAPPRIMRTFAEALDFAGKTVHPVATHAMSGLGTTEREYSAACAGASIGEGLAVQGEEVKDSRPAVTAWLERINVIKGGNQ